MYTFVLACIKTVIQINEDPNYSPTFSVERLVIASTKSKLKFFKAVKLQKINMDETQNILLKASLKEKSGQRGATVSAYLKEDRLINSKLGSFGEKRIF